MFFGFNSALYIVDVPLEEFVAAMVLLAEVDEVVPVPVPVPVPVLKDGNADEGALEVREEGSADEEDEEDLEAEED